MCYASGYGSAVMLCGRQEFFPRRHMMLRLAANHVGSDLIRVLAEFDEVPIVGENLHGAASTSRLSRVLVYAHGVRQYHGVPMRFPWCMLALYPMHFIQRPLRILACRYCFPLQPDVQLEFCFFANRSADVARQQTNVSDM